MLYPMARGVGIFVCKTARGVHHEDEHGYIKSEVKWCIKSRSSQRREPELKASRIGAGATHMALIMPLTIALHIAEQ